MACIYCQSKDHKLKYKIQDIFSDTHYLHQCQECDCHFLFPQPTKEQLKRAYSADYYGKGEKKFNSSIIEKIRQLYAWWTARSLANRTIEGGKILDVGFGSGDFLNQLNKLNKYQLYGIELPGVEKRFDFDSQNIILQTKDFNELDFPDNYFDAITFFHVFEHLSEPKKVIENIHRLVKPNGIIILSFPNIKSWQAGLFKRYWFHLDPPRHLHFFNPDMLIQIMEEKGFELLKKKQFHPIYNPYGMVQSMLNIRFNRREFLYEGLKGNKEYVKDTSRLIFIAQIIFMLLTVPFYIVLDFIESFFGKGATIEIMMQKKVLS